MAGAYSGPPRRVRRALVAAASRISTTDNFANPRQLVRVDGVPVIVNILFGLRTAGIKHVVITLGHAAHLLAKEVLSDSYGDMTVELVWCEESSWKRGHASNILAARSMFLRDDEPFLLVMSDHIFDPRLFQRLATRSLGRGEDACVLIDDSAETVAWAMPGGAHCKAYCRFGHCGSLVKVLKGEGDGDRVSRIGKKLAGFDALEAGAYVAYPSLFQVLHRLLADSIYCTLADAMAVIAADGGLRYLAVNGLDWFGQETVASLPMDVCSPAVVPEWRQRALCMLGKTSPKLGAVGALSRRLDDIDISIPLYELGSPIGSGGSSVVVEAKAQQGSVQQGSNLSRLHAFGGPLGEQHLAASSAEGSAGCSSPGLLMPLTRRQQRGVAVKVIRKDQAEECGVDERSIMWEVHVLQKLNHDHIVRVMDVIEVIDATYIIMERVDGPELTDFMATQPNGRIRAATARRLFSHVLSGLRHAHQRGFLHCDIKPDNVRLHKDCNHAVLTDWGCARQPGMRSEHYMCGTPAYASPEQLTGYSPDTVTGRRKLCPATDVWSLGVTYFQMVAGRLPFEAGEHEALVRLVLATEYTVPDCVEAEDADLINQMLLLLPLDRASVDELCAHPALVATGTFEDGPPAKPEVILECGVCCDDDSGSDGVSDLWRSLLRSSRLRRILWCGLYAALCAVAVFAR